MDQRLEKGGKFFYRVTSVNNCRRRCKTLSGFIQKNIRAKAETFLALSEGTDLQEKTYASVRVRSPEMDD